MDIKKRIAELEAMHAEQVRLYQQAEQSKDNARMNVVKIEGALEILREQLTEEIADLEQAQDAISTAVKHLDGEEKAEAQGA